MSRRAAWWLGAALLLVGATGRTEPARERSTASRSLVSAAAQQAAVTESEGGVVNLSTASPEELERLPGIGPAKARAIVEHRQRHPMRRVDDLTRVKGFGRKTLGRLRPYLTVSGPTTLKETPARK